MQENQPTNNKQQPETIQASSFAESAAMLGISTTIISIILWLLLNKCLTVLHVGFTLPLVVVFSGFIILCIISFFCFYLPLFFVASYVTMQLDVNQKILLSVLFDGIKKIQDKQEINMQKLVDEHIKNNYIDINLE